MPRNEIKFMESAIAVAEELNFTLAAEKIHVSQPTVTRNISVLEKSFGVELFARDRKKVTVKDAGRAYVKEARIAVLHSERAVQAARAAMQNAEVMLHIGKSPYINPFLISTLHSLELPLFPQLRIELSSHFSCELVHEILAGGLDLAIATEPPESARLTMAKIEESPFYIAMSEEDELANHSIVTLDALANRNWVLFERRIHPPLYDAVMQLAHHRNVRPAKIQHIVIPEEAFCPVVQNSCVAFTVKSGALRIARNGVTVRPLAEETLSLKTYLISHAENESKVLSELVRAFMRKISNMGKVQQLSPLISP